MSAQVWAATGHRPDKLGGYGAAGAKLTNFARDYLAAHRPDRVISGMALGWDQAWCEAAIMLEIPVIAAIPFEGQELRWPTVSRDRFYRLRSLCAQVVTVSPGGYSAQAMYQRDKWMVDNSTAVIALWNGSRESGTGRTVCYAEQVGREVVNLWPWWTA